MEKYTFPQSFLHKERCVHTLCIVLLVIVVPLEVLLVVVGVVLVVVVVVVVVVVRYNKAGTFEWD